MPTKTKKTTNRAQKPDVLALLTEQHSEVDELFEAIESGNGDRAELFVQLADKLAAHAGAEEKLFYPNTMSPETEELLRESVEEHLAMKRTLADMLELDPDDDEEIFAAKLSLLKEQVSHHAHEEEEAKLFPLIRKLFDKEQLREMADEYLGLFEELLADDPRLRVPQETNSAAPLPTADAPTAPASR
jgi:hypothetical protein